MKAIVWIILSMALLIAPAYAETQPEWAKSMRAPKSANIVFSVGFAESEDLNAAMASSWTSALANAVRINIPEVTTLGEVTKEGLRGSDYQRESGLDLDRISVVGTSENDRSPYIENHNGKYKVWRLLEWTKSGIQATRKTIISEQQAINARRKEISEINNGYVTDNDVDTSRATVEKAKKAIASLNSNNSRQNQLKYIEMVIKNIKCGTTMESLKSLLGPGSKDNVDFGNQTRFGHYVIAEVDGEVFNIADSNGYVIREVCQ